jgi:hypothetical protein
MALFAKEKYQGEMNFSPGLKKRLLTCKKAENLSNKLFIFSGVQTVEPLIIKVGNVKTNPTTLIVLSVQPVAVWAILPRIVS